MLPQWPDKLLFFAASCFKTNSQLRYRFHTLKPTWRRGSWLFICSPFIQFRELIKCKDQHETYFHSGIIIWLFWEFFTPALDDGFSLELEWQQVSKTLHSIQTNLNNMVVWMVSTFLQIFKSSSPFKKPLVIIPRAPVTIGITVTFMFNSFLFSSLARSRYLSIFPLSFIFTQFCQDGKIHYSTGPLFCWRSPGLVVRLRLGDLFVSQNSRKF